MKHIFAFGTVIVSGALLAAACTATDSDADPDTTPNTSGGGSSGDGGTSGSGGSAGTTATGNTTSTGNTVGSTSTTGSGGTYSSGGADSGGAGGWAGEESTTGEHTTTTTSTTTTTTGGGGTTACLGDDEVEAHDLPDCDDLSYASVECELFDPPEPFGVTHCKQFEAHATPEAFVAMFECLDTIDEADACSEAHDDAVRLCRDGNLDDEDESNDGVIPLTCPSELAREKCANMGCPEIDTDVDGTCDVYLSAFTPSGVDHVIACTNEFTEDESGGAWGAGPDTTGCGDVFLECVVGLRQPH